MVRLLCPMMLVILFVSVALCAFSGELLVTEIMPINYRIPQQLLPTLAPLVPAPGKLSATNDHLIVTTTRENVHQIKAILAALDRPPRSLLVSIRYGQSDATERTTGKASGEIGQSDLEELSTDDPDTYEPHGEASTAQTQAHSPSIAVQVWRTQSASDSRRNQQLRVIDGVPACISRGKLAPSGTQNVLFIHRTFLLDVEATTQYVNLGTGFCVVPHVHGDHVLLDIAPHSAHADLGDSGTIETKTIRTSVSVPLGRWVRIGAIGHQDRERQSGRYLSTRATESVFVKVDDASP
jgi:hypothetical protein